jgi:hypothetical protein
MSARCEEAAAYIGYGWQRMGHELTDEERNTLHQLFMWYGPYDLPLTTTYGRLPRYENIDRIKTAILNKPGDLDAVDQLALELLAWMTL